MRPMWLPRETLETLYAVYDGALSIALPPFVRAELDGYLDCGLLCRGFARPRCGMCKDSRVVAFSCKGRGSCPSCLGRRMCATAAASQPPACGKRRFGYKAADENHAATVSAITVLAAAKRAFRCPLAPEGCGNWNSTRRASMNPFVDSQLRR